MYDVFILIMVERIPSVHMEIRYIHISVVLWFGNELKSNFNKPLKLLIGCSDSEHDSESSVLTDKGLLTCPDLHRFSRAFMLEFDFKKQLKINHVINNLKLKSSAEWPGFFHITRGRLTE